MLCKLAWGNVRRAGRDYLVYLLTLTLGVTVFYAFNTISMQVDIAGIDEKRLGAGNGQHARRPDVLFWPVSWPF